MNSLDANTRDSKSKGDVRSLRLAGNIPGIVYGGPEQNQKITVLKKTVKSLLDKGSFLSNIITLNLDGKPQNVLPREISYNVLSDEPTHIDFLRIVPGVKIRIEVPVEFINHETSPGLKRGGVLNIVRRKIELKCPSEKIPESIVIDLNFQDMDELLESLTIWHDALLTAIDAEEVDVLSTFNLPSDDFSDKLDLDYLEDNVEFINSLSSI